MEKDLFSYRLYPAPPITDGGTVTRSTLRELLEQDSLSDANHANVQFALANSLLRDWEIQEAINHYTQALKFDQESGYLRTNFAVALIVRGSLEEALIQLRRVLFGHPELFLAHYYSGLVHFELKQFDAAHASFEESLRIEPGNAKALSYLAQVSELRGDVSAARTWHEQLLSHSANDSAAQGALALGDFEKGRELYLQGNFLAALDSWGESYRRFSRPFVANETIALGLRSLVQEYNRGHGFERDLERYRSGLAANPDETSGHYELVCRFLFSLGLIPEGWERADSLLEERLRWEGSLESLGEHPYPHFRFALLHLYTNELGSAIEELTLCSDRLPLKKQRGLKIKELLEFAKLLLELERAKAEYRIASIPLNEWERLGFNDPFQQRAWKESLLPPTVAAQWRDASFSPKQAGAWNKIAISPERARVWLDAGFADPEEVKSWERAGFSPSEADAWKKECPLPRDLVVQFRRAGFTEPQLAYSWSRILSVPYEAFTWHELGFSPESASDWREAGFREPHKAHYWKELGHDPASATRAFNDPSVLPANNDSK